MASQTISLKRVADNFGSAASCYDKHADLQRSISQQLRRQWPALPAGAEVIDLGCGTGHDSAWLQSQGLVVHAADLAQGMLDATAVNAPGCATHCCDAGQLASLKLQVDALWTNCMLQWAGDLANACSQIHKSLKPGATITGSLFTEGSLQELKNAWAAVDDHPHVVELPSAQHMRDALEAAGFNIIWQQPLVTQRYFQDLAAIRDHLQGLGATNAVKGRPKGLMGRGQLQALMTALEQYREPVGIRISWCAWLFQAQKEEL